MDIRVPRLHQKQVKEHDDIISNQTFLVRKDIYEAIGSPDMTTPEGFKADSGESGRDVS